MHLSSIFRAIPNSTNDGAALSGANLKPGDRMVGRVLSLDADGRALIDLGRFRAKAQMGFPVQSGQTLNLRVVQSGTPLHLQADVKREPQGASSLPQLNFTQALSAKHQQQLVTLLESMSNLPKAASLAHQTPERIQMAMAQVKTLFDAIPIDKPMAQLVQWLQGAVEDRGILFEKKLADAIVAAASTPEGAEIPNTGRIRSVIMQDLKPHLLVLKAFIEGSDIQKTIPEGVTKNEIDFLRQSVEKLLNHMGQQQDRAVNNWREGDSFQIFTHMLPFKEQNLPVQIKVYYPKKAESEKDTSHHRIALLLQMDQLGPVRADLSMAGRHLKIQIFVQNDDVRQRFELHTEDVTQALQGDFEEVVVVTRVSEEKIAQFNQQEQRGVSLGRIDIQV